MINTSGLYETIKDIRPEDMSPKEHFNTCLTKKNLDRLNYLLEKSSNRHIHTVLNLLDDEFKGLSSMLKSIGVWYLSGSTAVYVSNLQTPLTENTLCKKMAYVFANNYFYENVYKKPTETLLDTNSYELSVNSSNTEHEYLKFLEFLEVIILSPNGDRNSLTYSLTEFGRGFIFTLTRDIIDHTSITKPETLITYIDNSKTDNSKNFKFLNFNIENFKFLSELFNKNNVSSNVAVLCNIFFTKRETKKVLLDILEKMGLFLLLLSFLLAVVKKSPDITLSHLFYALLYLVPKLIK